MYCLLKSPLGKGLIAIIIGLMTISCAAAPKGASGTVAESKADQKTGQKVDQKADQKLKELNQSDDSSASSSAKDESELDSQLWLEANTTYAEQNFSSSLYAKILEADSYCLSAGSCGDVQYLFKDVLMVATVGEFGSTEVALLPYQSISKSQALSYAEMLDINGVIDFENSLEDSVTMDSSEGSELVTTES